MKTPPSSQMKIARTSIGMAIASLALTSGLAQQATPTAPPPPVRLSAVQPGAGHASHPDEQPFSLDFGGGRVQEFVEAVEKATKEPFNVIIPESAHDLVIPPVRVREVTLSPLLAALSATSQERKAVATGRASMATPGGRQETPQFEWFNTAFKFSPTPGAAGNMVWQLLVDKATPIPQPPAPTPIPRFYQLKPNLEAGLKVEDITTVAQTAWAMMKLKPTEIPELKVHEESGILIAVGSEVALGVIDSVLRELPRKQATGTPAGQGTLVFPQAPQSTPRAR